MAGILHAYPYRDTTIKAIDFILEPKARYQTEASRNSLETSRSWGSSQTYVWYDKTPNCKTREKITRILQTFTTNSLYAHLCAIVSQLWIWTMPMNIIRPGTSLTQLQQFHTYLFSACSSCCQLEGQGATIRNVSHDTSGSAQWIIRGEVYIPQAYNLTPSTHIPYIRS